MPCFWWDSNKLGRICIRGEAQRYLDRVLFWLDIFVHSDNLDSFYMSWLRDEIKLMRGRRNCFYLRLNLQQGFAKCTQCQWRMVLVLALKRGTRLLRFNNFIRQKWWGYKTVTLNETNWEYIVRFYSFKGTFNPIKISEAYWTEANIRNLLKLQKLYWGRPQRK